MSRKGKKKKGGTKYDKDKAPLDLLSTPWVFEVARVLGEGAVKYSRHNWRDGIAQSRLMSAALRHIYAHNAGEDIDPETGLSHLGHASCCLMFAYEMMITHGELDDRYRLTEKM